MPTTNYYSVNGEVYGESTDGVMTTYMKDAQGSVIGTIQAGGVVNTYAYTPYGQLLAKTGTGPDPRFMWNGGNQYRTTELAHASHYVQARHYDSTQASWTTVDPVWPEESPYGYAESNPATFIAPSGLGAIAVVPACGCLPIPHVAGGMTKSDRRYKCYLRACQEYCSNTTNLFNNIAKACSSPGNCKDINDAHDVCDSSNSYFVQCGTAFVDPGGPWYNGACANKSNFPCPKYQTWHGLLGNLGGEYCCVECKMRFCCYSLGQGKFERVLAAEQALCDKGNVVRRGGHGKPRPKPAR